MNLPAEQLFKRIGPRPLGLHLGLASVTLTSSLAALPQVREGRYPWMSELETEAQALHPHLQNFALETLIEELSSQGHDRLQAMISGIRKYQAHSYARLESPISSIWEKGATRLLDYAAQECQADAPIAFLVPSLVNRGYILDLQKNRSFARALADEGIRTLLVDWGTPGTLEREFSLDNYVVDVLCPALDHVTKCYPDSPIHLVGYCMGGTLTVAQALHQQEKLTSLIALAAPWNFHAGLSAAGKFLLAQDTAWQSVLDTFNEMPVDLLQAFFASLDPNLCMNKFALFDSMNMDSEKAAEFVALEDWLNDGVPLVKKVAMQCFSDWYGENTPYCGNWVVADKKICPQNLKIPVMLAVPKSDKIVPMASALGLAEQIEDVTVIHPPSGHIGMVAGSRARSGLWSDVIQWIKQ